MEKEQVFEKPSVLICGYGIVGKNIKQTFTWADLYDVKFDGITTDTDGTYRTNKSPRKSYDFAFICVPTPMIGETGEANTKYVEDVLKVVDADIYIIKSTIPPTTTERLEAETYKNIVFSPEYQGNTQHANIDYDFVILGGDKLNTVKVAQLYQYACTANLKVHFTDSRTAELCKYMENTYLASKVVFCNEFYRIDQIIGVDYEELRELFVADPRVNRSHTFVYGAYPYFDSKCFNKDLPAIKHQAKLLGYDASFIGAILDTNAKFMKEVV